MGDNTSSPDIGASPASIVPSDAATDETAPSVPSYTRIYPVRSLLTDVRPDDGPLSPAAQSDVEPPFLVAVLESDRAAQKDAQAMTAQWRENVLPATVTAPPPIIRSFSSRSLPPFEGMSRSARSEPSRSISGAEVAMPHIAVRGE